MAVDRLRYGRNFLVWGWGGFGPVSEEVDKDNQLPVAAPRLREGTDEVIAESLVGVDRAVIVWTTRLGPSISYLDGLR